jgi:hypothetical protein
MDAEITRLETRRTKTRSLKQAMMQELLTGRTAGMKQEPTDVFRIFLARPAESLDQ